MNSENKDENALNKESEAVETVETEKEAATGKKRKINFHIIILAFIVLLAGISAYRLYRWNQGTRLEPVDETADTSDLDVETLDMIIPMDSAALEGREDDGVTTILCLGNNPFSDDRSGDGLASKIAGKTGAVIYDCSFPDSTAACKNPVYDPAYTKDHFNLYYVVECFRNNEFTAINSIAGDEPDPRYQEAVDVMKTVDMDKVDAVIIMYDSTDYNTGSPSDDPNNPGNVSTFSGGLRMSLNNIRNTWPHIRVFLLSPTYAQAMDEDGNLLNGTITDFGNGPLVHYVYKESEVAMDCGVSFVDNYFGTINEDNYEGYMKDHMRYNDAGREKLADRIADIINANMGTQVSEDTGN